MVEILIVTHGNMAEEILKSAEMIVGKQQNITAIGLFCGDDIDEFRDEIAGKIRDLGKGEGVLVFVDLYGGSPANAVVISLNTNPVKDVKFQCVTGLNLPMLLEALTVRGCMGLEELKEHCMQTGRMGIRDIRREFEEFTKACR